MHKRGGGGGGGGGAEVSPGYCIVWMGAQHPEAPLDNSRGWTLHHGCSRRQSRRRLSTLSWRVVCGSLGSARCISGRRTSLNPGPVSMPSSHLNHCGGLGEID